MRKNALILTLICLLLLPATGCKKGDAASKALSDYAEAVKKNDRQTVVKLYPAVAARDSLALIDVDDASTTVTGDTTVFKLKNDREVTVVTDSAGTATIIASRGLFLYAPDALELAVALGRYSPELSDVENSRRLADKDFDAWLTEVALAALRKQMSLVVTTSGDGSEDVISTASIRLTNNSAVDLASGDYSLSIKEVAGDGRTINTALGGVALARGASTVFRHDFTGHFGDYGGDIYSSVTFTFPVDKLLKVYKPTGNEYDQYQQTKK